MLPKHVDVDALIHQEKRREAALMRKARKPHTHHLAYANRLLMHDIPKYEMPEASIDARAAAQLIRDELALDGNTVQNMATFVSSWMEPEVDKLLKENLGKNFVDKEEYPATVELQSRCVNMLGRLYNSPKGCRPTGTATIGSSEAFMLAALAMKFNWRRRMKALGKPTDKPNIVFGANAQVVLKKFAVYFDVEHRLVPVSESSRYVMDPKEAIKYVDENTICVVAILGSTFTGHFEDVKGLSHELDKLQKEKGLDIPIHVDAASGGFVAPFAFPSVEWDFRLPRVKSINVSGHKYGLVYPGLGWVMFRDESDLAPELIFHLDYLGGDNPTYTLNFSRSSVNVTAQYYNFIRLGRSGYRDIMCNCLDNAQFLSHILEQSGHFKLLSEIHKDNKPGVPVVSFSLTKPGKTFDEYDVMHVLQQKGWTVPAYKLPPNLEQVTILRVVVREIHTQDILENLARDLIQAVENLQEREQLNIQKLSEGKVPKGVVKMTDHPKEPTKKKRDQMRAAKDEDSTATFSSVC